MMAATFARPSGPGVSLTRDGALGIITLNRPPANSYNLAFVQDLAAAVEQARGDDDVRVVLVKSALEKFFSAGADVKAFGENSHETNMQMIRAEHAVLEQIEQTPKIFIAMIGGHCLGGGLEIALACDLRFGGAGDFKVGLPEVTLGLLPGNGGTQRLPRLIGKNKALDLMITGRTLNPQEASELGIFDRLFPMGELEQQTHAYALAVASGASLAVGSIKQAVNQGIQMPLHEGLAYERGVTAKLFQSEDAREGITAFTEKRKPEYKGK
jgi:enoyl-CoA hydratase/carnithine racemase